MNKTNLQNKRVLIGICGGIAAYKILELIRRLKEQDAHVKVILTASGKKFVTPLSITALGGELEHDSAMAHIDLARWAEVLLIAPATANFITKCRYGLADDLLSTVVLATTSPLLIAPAMNQQMWQNSATQKNILRLQQRGVTILGPASGSQACGETGPGRMLEAADLLQILDAHFAPQILNNKHLVITAGPTQEAIDPVRYLSNHSSGKMGYALANAALKLGAKVTLISGPTHITKPTAAKLKFISVISAQEMYQAVMQEITLQKTDIFIGCAAVADYTPIHTQPSKIKKNSGNLTLELQPTPDILAAVAKLPKTQRPLTIGFAAETEDLIANAQQKLRHKALDLIIANAVGSSLGFNQDENEVIIVRKNAKPLSFTKMRKEILAYKILQSI